MIATPARAAAPDWLRDAARQVLPNYPEDTNAVVLLSQQITTVKDNGEISTVSRRACRILRPQGRDAGIVRVYFDSETRVTFLKAWSIPATGAEYEVKEKDAVEASPFAEALYTDSRYKLLKIPAADPGNVVGWEFEQKHRPSILQDIWDFQENIPVRRAEYTLELPPGWEFRTQWLHYTGPQPRALGERRWTWNLENIPALESEDDMPAWLAVAGQLGITYIPRDAMRAGKPQTTWSEVGGWYAQMTSGRRQSTPEIKQKVAELTAADTPVIGKIRKLAAFVQREIRYVAIEIGIGGYQPHAAADVFANRYGDCKDKATLLSTMLRDIGVESFYMLVHSNRGVLAPDFPTPLRFNHVILALRLPDGDDDGRAGLYAVRQHQRLGSLLFFDPTDPSTPLGYLPPQLQASRALMVTESGGELVELPLMKPATNRLLRTARLALNASGTLSGTVYEIQSGALATGTRVQLLQAPGTEKVKVLERFLGGFLTGYRLSNALVQNAENFDVSLVVQYQFEADRYAQAAGNLLLFRPRVLGQKGRGLLEGKARKHSVEFRTASLETDIFDFVVPEGYEVDELPPAIQMTYPFAEYRSSVQTSGKTIRYTRSYQVNQVHVPAEQLENLRQFYRNIAADEDAAAVLKRSGP